MHTLHYDQSLYPFQSRWLNIDGNTVHYIDEGAGSVILFSHAAIGSSFMYRQFIQHLSKSFRCVAMDYPGFGLSQESTNYTFSISSQAKVLQSFIETLGLREITLLGHDSPSGLMVAGWRPELFRALILTDTQIFPSTEYGRLHTMLGFVGSDFFQHFTALTNLLVRGTVNFGIRTRKLSKAEKQQYYAIHRTAKRRRAVCQVLYSIRAEQNTMRDLKNAFEKQLNNKPMLLIYGSDDPVQGLGIPERIKGIVQNAELHFVKGEGHFPHEGQPQFMVALIEQWMKENNQ